MNIRFSRWMAAFLVPCLIVELLVPAAGAPAVQSAPRVERPQAGVVNREALSPPIIFGALVPFAPLVKIRGIQTLHQTFAILFTRDWMPPALFLLGSIAFGGVLYWRSPRLEKKSAAPVITHEFSIALSGTEEMPLEYLEATIVFLKTLKENPRYKDFDIGRLGAIHFVPWYRSLGHALFAWMKSAETLDDIVHPKNTLNESAEAAKKKSEKILEPEKITVIVHWHPRLFMEELKNKVGAATFFRVDERESENAGDAVKKFSPYNVVMRSWTPASDAGMWKFLALQLGIAAASVSFLVWPLAMALGNDADSAFKINMYALALIFGAVNSYYTNGLVARLTAWLMGGTELVLDPSKTIELLPASSLSSPEHHRGNIIMTQLPNVLIRRSLEYWKTLAPALFVYGVFLALLLSPALFTFAILSAGGVAVFSVAHTGLRLAALALSGRGKAFFARLSLRPGVATLLSVLQGIAAQSLVIFHEVLRWFIPSLLILAAANPSVRATARDLVRDLERQFTPRARHALMVPLLHAA